MILEHVVQNLNTKFVPFVVVNKKCFRLERSGQDTSRVNIVIANETAVAELASVCVFHSHVYVILSRTTDVYQAFTSGRTNTVVVLLSHGREGEGRGRRRETVMLIPPSEVLNLRTHIECNSVLLKDISQASAAHSVTSLHRV